MDLGDWEQHAKIWLPKARRFVAGRLEALPIDKLMQDARMRFELGEAHYGTLDLEDGRDWHDEEYWELVDGVNYRLFNIAKNEGP